jgi:hypothetical protein
VQGLRRCVSAAADAARRVAGVASRADGGCPPILKRGEADARERGRLAHRRVGEADGVVIARAICVGGCSRRNRDEGCWAGYGGWHQ